MLTTIVLCGLRTVAADVLLEGGENDLQSVDGASCEMDVTTFRSSEYATGSQAASYIDERCRPTRAVRGFVTKHWDVVKQNSDVEKRRLGVDSAYVSSISQGACLAALSRHWAVHHKAVKHIPVLDRR